ncbi:MAG: DUF2326 domain-containing protein [Deltaproteobacteria bacterium]|nr:DUF2326 domain-containing protein [Deltaproteobacteria bacterium]
MIHSVKCNKPSFKNIKFEPGFNVILAERTKESTKKDSRNGLGKSTLIEIIHFCLGGNKGETLKKAELKDWSFTLDLDLGNKRYSITRNTLKEGKIVIDGDCSGWPVKPETDKNTGEQVLSIREWTKVLGVLMFDLQYSYPDLKYAPTFRSLISYFIRRDGKQGGFLNPFQQYKAQKEWDKQVNNAFLLDLGWEYASKWQILKDRVNVIDQIKQEAKSGILSNLMGTIGELDALKIRLQDQITREGQQLRDFKVHPQYKNIETEANQLTFKIHELANMNIMDRNLIEHYEANLREEAEAKPEAVTKMYEEAKIHFPNALAKRIDDVLSFHKQVVINRKEFLNSEMERIKQNIAEREQQISSLSYARVELMRVLEKHGALEEYTELQNKQQRLVAELNELNIRIENLRKFEQGKNAITVEKVTLKQQASTDLDERRGKKELATLLFNSNSKALYDAPGILSIDISETGFKFNVSIKRSGSHGIGNMEIFCYDLMLAQIWAQKAKSPIFLIHDSIIFADVDERQTAMALELAEKESKERRLQYICTLNSDTLPTKDFSKDFKLEQYVRMRLTDATEDGGLLGQRF